jgi:hypothetical protein
MINDNTSFLSLFCIRSPETGFLQYFSTQFWHYYTLQSSDLNCTAIFSTFSSLLISLYLSQPKYSVTQTLSYYLSGFLFHDLVPTTYSTLSLSLFHHSWTIRTKDSKENKGSWSNESEKVNIFEMDSADPKWLIIEREHPIWSEVTTEFHIYYWSKKNKWKIKTN